MLCGVFSGEIVVLDLELITARVLQAPKLNASKYKCIIHGEVCYSAVCWMMEGLLSAKATPCSLRTWEFGEALQHHRDAEFTLTTRPSSIVPAFFGFSALSVALQILEKLTQVVHTTQETKNLPKTAGRKEASVPPGCTYTTHPLSKQNSLLQ